MNTTYRTLLAMLVMGSLGLCSCRAMPERASTSGKAPIVTKVQGNPSGNPIVLAQHTSPALPQGAFTGDPAVAHHHGMAGHCPHCSPASTRPFHFSSHAEELQWYPDGLALPWPRDEYLCDGGDLNEDANIKKDESVVGVDQEDTIAHYKTLDGRKEITHSNKVCIYAPRFAAVRHVTVPITTEVHERMAGIEKADKLTLHGKTFVPTTAIQPEAVRGEQAIDLANIFRERRLGNELARTNAPYMARGEFLPFEDFDIIRRGVYEQGDKPRLAISAQAAEVWLDTKAVQVVIDGKMAVEAAGTSGSQETRMYELEGKPRLRICKVASKSDAKVGETVEFTLRFDNIGEQPVSHVTIIDSLTTRLEYVEGSQSASREAKFDTQENEGESLVLRWALTEPLKVNEGGIIRFQCRVR
ncbi:MAG: hypothetical protein ACR2FY_02145 [Pirellulaceae bacterium]